MTIQELQELYYIAHMRNIPSILRYGILSNKRAVSLAHISIAMQEIQERRSIIFVPGGRKLHEYANLYFSARNPMLFKRREQVNILCVLRISPKVLFLPGVVITDGNASSTYVRFAAAPDGISIVDRKLTFAADWNDPDESVYFRKKVKKCAEVLVPDCINPSYIIGAYVGNQDAKINFDAMNTGLKAEISGYMFFL